MYQPSNYFTAPNIFHSYITDQFSLPPLKAENSSVNRKTYQGIKPLPGSYGNQRLTAHAHQGFRSVADATPRTHDKTSSSLLNGITKYMLNINEVNQRTDLKKTETSNLATNHSFANTQSRTDSVSMNNNFDQRTNLGYSFNYSPSSYYKNRSGSSTLPSDEEEEEEEGDEEEGEEKEPYMNDIELKDDGTKVDIKTEEEKQDGNSFETYLRNEISESDHHKLDSYLEILNNNLKLQERCATDSFLSDFDTSESSSVNSMKEESTNEVYRPYSPPSEYSKLRDSTKAKVRDRSSSDSSLGFDLVVARKRHYHYINTAKEIQERTGALRPQGRPFTRGMTVKFCSFPSLLSVFCGTTRGFSDIVDFGVMLNNYWADLSVATLPSYITSYPLVKRVVFSSDGPGARKKLERPGSVRKRRCNDQRKMANRITDVFLKRKSSVITKHEIQNGSSDSSCPHSENEETKFDNVNECIEQLFGYKQYVFVRVIRSGSGNPTGARILKLETILPDNKVCTAEFVKQYVAYPRYKADMKIFVMPLDKDHSSSSMEYQKQFLYTDPSMLKEDLNNGVISSDSIVYKCFSKKWYPAVSNASCNTNSELNRVSNFHFGPSIKTRRVTEDIIYCDDQTYKHVDSSMATFGIRINKSNRS
ncbi:hypothetical protein NADFUDRAFT_63437 [Nadsonia fulvescens var. elongata DSM 6958]|uniref:Uncharacterized protein n=1 Tax=Nadsonia fulvescens var. elongata DSM 6958 TaxID=857566 RepID=A0A1E3PR89_9ASCO|nr:hypothetical protein NADFUDRAFT_63437 [Nadsonia fulvescens var. elongata DSM 6958]